MLTSISVFLLMVVTIIRSMQLREIDRRLSTLEASIARCKQRSIKDSETRNTDKNMNVQELEKLQCSSKFKLLKDIADKCEGHVAGDLCPECGFPICENCGLCWVIDWKKELQA